MKKYPFILPLVNLIFIFCFTFQLDAQNSYEFSALLPVDGVEINSIDNLFYGEYKSDNGQLSYEFNSDGIFIHTINIQVLTQETIRENSQYYVRNEHVFGVSDDSIPYVFQDDKYFFGIKSTIQLVGMNSVNKLLKLNSNSFIVNYKTDYGFTPSLFEFRNNQLNISHFDYDFEGDVFKKIKDKEMVDSKDSTTMKTILLKPTQKEWQKLMSKELFGESNVFQKVI